MNFIQFFATYFISIANIEPNICDLIISSYNNKFLASNCTIAKNNHVYWRFEIPMSFNESLFACSMIKGGNLISVHNFFENVMLHNLCNLVSINGDYSDSCWIGLRRKNFDCSESFVSVDGSPVDYLAFQTGEPDCDNQRITSQACGMLNKNKVDGIGGIRGWTDGGCYDAMRVAICKL